MATTTKYTTINISKWKKAELDKHMGDRPNISFWLEGAIDDKIEKENGCLCGLPEMKLVYLTKEQAAQLEGGN